MAAQNIYDDPDFLAGYASLQRQVDGLDGAPEWPAMQRMLPNLAGRRVVDLGCGFGWFSRWAASNGASSVLGVDLSSSMLERAIADTRSDRVAYQQADLDEVELEDESCDVVFSSLALHYVEDLDRLLGNVGAATAAGGSLVFSVEHPIYSAPSSQQFETSDGGDRVWPLNNYLVEGRRVTNWFVDGVVKQHRTVATYLNSVIGAGFVVQHVLEFGIADPAPETGPGSDTDDRHRPWFLIVQAIRSPELRSEG